MQIFNVGDRVRYLNSNYHNDWNNSIGTVVKPHEFYPQNAVYVLWEQNSGLYIEQFKTLGFENGYPVWNKYLIKLHKDYSPDQNGDLDSDI